MSTRVPLLGTVFVLLTAMPVQADRLAPDHANGLQVPTGLQQQHPSDMRAVGSLNAHAGTLPLIAQANRLSQSHCYCGRGGRTNLPAGGESCDCC
jgi:hypothetical protein